MKLIAFTYHLAAFPFLSVTLSWTLGVTMLVIRMLAIFISTKPGNTWAGGHAGFYSNDEHCI